MSINIAVITGNLTATPELKVLEKGTKVTSFNVAVSRNYVKKGEERGTDFIRVDAFDNNAEFICKWFTKGSPIGITGSIQVDNYEKDGEKRTITKIICNQASFIGNKDSNATVPYEDKVSNPKSVEYDEELPF